MRVAFPLLLPVLSLALHPPAGKKTGDLGANLWVGTVAVIVATFKKLRRGK